MLQKAFKHDSPGVGRSARPSSGTFDAANNHHEQATGFGMFMLKAVISGRGDELVDLAKVNLFR